MTNYVLETSSLLDKSFVEIFQRLEDDKSTGKFFIDKNINNDINDLYAIGKRIDAEKLENILSLINNIAATEYFEANGFLNLDTIKNLCENNSLLILLTQKENVFMFFSAIENESFQINKIEENKLINWTNLPKQINNAFYIEKDIYINFVDTDNLTIDYVFSPKYGFLKLDKSFCLSGGEGTCYRTYNGLFVKIYKSKHITYANYKKLQTMLAYDLGNPYIVWPKDIVYYRGDFVGYAMEELKDTKSIDYLRDCNFHGYTVLDRFLICRNFLKLVEYLHEKNILVCDMKFDNIMVDDDRKVFLIDTGSFQIEDYSCVVYNREFSAKEYHGDELKKHLRVLEDEYFPINKILFEIMMLKNPYYSETNIEIDATRGNIFHFSLDKPKSIKVKPQMYMVYWYNLSEKMREYFYYYFKEGKITPIQDWIMELNIFITKKQKEIIK